MSSARREYFLLIAGLLLLVVTGAAVYYIPRMPSQTRDTAEIKAIVTTFGLYEKTIPLSGDIEAARQALQQEYNQYVTDELMQQWRVDPSLAPGRLTSSPWPDSIVIDSVTPQGAGYVVSGRVILMTSDAQTKGTNAGEIPVVLQVIRESGQWQIAAYQEQVAAPQD